MGETDVNNHYRVIVEVLTPDADGDLMGKTVLELMGPSELLARFAPGAVAEQLGAERAAVTVVMPEDMPTSPLPPGVDSPPSEPLPQAEAPKRKRRTKAEKEADDAAQALGFRDAAHRAEAATAAEVASESLPAPEPADDPVPEVSPVAPGQQTEPAVPYNPFAASK
jgi:hypothetical protein